MSFTALGTGGEYKHFLTVNEMPNHTHPQNVTAGNSGNALRNDYQADGRGLVYAQGIDTSGAGGNQTHNNVQPWIAVYFFRRTA